MPKITKKSVAKKVVSADPQTEEIKRYIGFVTETFQDRVSALEEQITGLSDGVDSKYYSLEQNLNDNFEDLSEKLDVHTEMIGKLMLQVEDIKINMQEKIGRDEFNKLETRLVSLDAFVYSTKAKSQSAQKGSK